MQAVWGVLALAVFLFWILLIGRFILQLLQSFARDWRPHGVVLVIAEVVYSATDPPLRAIRRVVPPLPLGGITLDLAFTLLFLITLIVLSLLRSLAGQ